MRRQDDVPQLDPQALLMPTAFQGRPKALVLHFLLLSSTPGATTAWLRCARRSSPHTPKTNRDCPVRSSTTILVRPLSGTSQAVWGRPDVSEGASLTSTQVPHRCSAHGIGAAARASAATPPAAVIRHGALGEWEVTLLCSGCPWCAAATTSDASSGHQVSDGEQAAVTAERQSNAERLHAVGCAFPLPPSPLPFFLRSSSRAQAGLQDRGRKRDQECRSIDTSIPNIEIIRSHFMQGRTLALMTRAPKQGNSPPPQAPASPATSAEWRPGSGEKPREKKGGAEPQGRNRSLLGREPRLGLLQRFLEALLLLRDLRLQLRHVRRLRREQRAASSDG